MENKKDSIIEMTVKLLIFCTIVVLSIIILDRFTNIFSVKEKNEPHPQESSDVKNEVINNDLPNKENDEVPELTDYDKYKSYTKIKIYPNGLKTPTTYINNAHGVLEKAGRKIKIIGNIDDAYVYIKAGANDKNGKFTNILSEFDGIWFYLQNHVFLGGQLDLSKSKFGNPSELTELLYNLKEVPLAENLTEYRKGDYKNLNLLKELTGERYIGSLVSTNRYGNIENLEIGYKCALNSDCKIELIQ